MKSRLIIAIGTVAAFLGLSLGLFSLPAAAATSDSASVVFDGATSSAWTNNPDSEVVGATAFDTASVTGDATQSPTGTVTYTFFANGTCTGSGSPAGTVTVDGDGPVPQSDTEGPLAAGAYSFNAIYGGDGTNDPSDPNACEPFTVAPGPSSTGSTVVDAGNSATWTNSEVTGASAYDTSTVSGVGAFTPSGTVTYTLFPNNSCSVGTGTPAGTVTIAGNGSVPQSDTEGPLAAGTYSFKAVYSGDANYSGSISSCEPFTVAPGPSSTATTVFDAATTTHWSGSETTGASAYDTSTVSGVGAFTPSGTVTYTLFPNNSCSVGTGTPAGTVTIAGNGSVPQSDTEGPLAAGTYSFKAVYSGDANYSGSISSCEPFTVAPGPSSTATTVFDAATTTHWSGSETTGASAYDTSTVSGVGAFTPSGTVTYTLFPNNSCSVGTGTPAGTVTIAGNGSVPQSDTEGPLAAGTYSFKAVYSGDANYSGSISSCEPFTVAPGPSSTATTVFDAATTTHWSGSETTGASAYDTSTVSGVGAFTPSGTVTYTLFPNNSCSVGTGTPAGTVTIAGNGSVPQSDTEGPLAAGTYSFKAVYSGDANYSGSISSCEPFTVAPGPSSTATTVFDAATTTHWSGSETTGASAYDTSTVSGVGAFTPSGTVTYTLFPNNSCSVGTGTPAGTVTIAGNGSVPQSDTEGPLAAGTYSFKAVYSGDANYSGSISSCEPFTVAPGPSSTATTVFDAATTTHWSGSETTGASAYDTSTVSGVGAFTPSGTVTYTLFPNNSCSVGTGTPAGTVTIAGNGSVPQSDTEGPLAAGTYSFKAVYSGDANYSGSISSCEPFTVAQGTPSPPTISNLPSSSVFGGNFTPVVATNGDGTRSVTSSTPGVCTLSGSTVVFNGVGTCTLTAHVAGTVNFGHRDGSPQSFSVGRAAPSSPYVANIPAGATEFASFVGAVATTGDGARSLASTTTDVCTVGPDGVTVTFVGFGACTLTAGVGQGAHYLAATGSPQTFTVNPAARGYWLVGSDGGIFSFGAAGFHGSMGGIPLQRPVVGITPTASRHGYWLVASDGGIFSFGDSSFYGSIPGVGLHPAGSGQPNSLNAPIVGMVPSTSGHGYFMVASDGGVFAFGDARFAGSCPGIGGCYGAAVAVMPDSTGNGYWLVTNLGAVYAFGDAGYYGGPPPESVPAVDAVATPDGRGYWVLYANGVVFSFGDAGSMGFPLGYVNSFNPAAAIFPTADGHGYWVAAARGDVFSYGDAPFMGSMSAAGLNGQIIAGFGF